MTVLTSDENLKIGQIASQLSYQRFIARGFFSSHFSVTLYLITCLDIFYIHITIRIEVERGFSLAKRCYGLGLIRTKLDTTTRSSIALSILTMNINHLAVDILCLLFWQGELWR